MKHRYAWVVFSAGIMVGIALAWSSSCGGGSDINLIPAPTIFRHDLYYGYYGSDDAQVDQTSGHVNLAWEMRWDGDAAAIKRLQTHHLPTVLSVQWPLYGESTKALPDAVAGLRALFDQYRASGVLQQIIVLYPIDEPDGRGFNDPDVLVGNSLLRGVAAEYAELSGVKLGVIYSTHWSFPGISSYDWVGFDDYGQRSGIFVNGEYDRLKNTLRPNQRIILVPGGADPWKQDPTEFFNMAENDPQVVALVPFIWIDNYGQSTHLGIHSNGMATIYHLIGLQIVSP